MIYDVTADTRISYATFRPACGTEELIDSVGFMINSHCEHLRLMMSLNSHMELFKHLLTYSFKALTVKYVFTLIIMTRGFDGFMVFLSSYKGCIDPSLGNSMFSS